MHDNDIFAVLTAFDRKNKSTSAFKLSHNSRWFREAVGGVAQHPIIDYREATPAEDAQSEEVTPDTVDRLVVTFRELMLTENLVDGIQAGTNPSSSHILLGHRGTKGISGRQYDIVVDDNLYIWLHDYHSAHGTAVGYRGQNQDEVRRKETWILAYKPGTDNRFGDITIHSGGLVIMIEFPNHAIADPQYVDNLRAFVKKCKEGVPAVDGFGLKSQATTQAPSEVQTLGERLIYYKGNSIGSGEFGQVHSVIRARDGKLFAAKIFKLPINNKRKLDEVDPVWLTKIRREFTIMKNNPHVSVTIMPALIMTLIIEQRNVVQVFELREIPEPMIIMTYYPDGNIVDAGIVDEVRRVTSFGQVLEGLAHLHANGVVHRDLKSENFLVEMKPFFKVLIADFGLANVVTDTTWLTTFCGSLKYVAPEVFPFHQTGHGPPVDVWSLGVIALEWIYGTLTPPAAPMPKKEGEHVAPKVWRQWVKTWTKNILEN